jgi:hypothetical protein
LNTGPFGLAKKRGVADPNRRRNSENLIALLHVYLFLNPANRKAKKARFTELNGQNSKNFKIHQRHLSDKGEAFKDK